MKEAKPAVSQLHLPLAELERILGKFTALASGAALALGALDRDAPRHLRRASKDLHRAFGQATASATQLAKAARRYARKHPWQAGSLLAAAGVYAALEATQRLRARSGEVAGAHPPGAGAVRTRMREPRREAGV